MTCWRIDLHLYWVLGSLFLWQNLNQIEMLGIVSFPNQIMRSFWPTRLRPDSVLQNNFISLWILHESCILVCVDEFGLLNRLISILEAQDIPVWTSNLKVRILPREGFWPEFCTKDSASTIISLVVVLRSYSQSYRDARHCQFLN
jgi:hypothetical protein